MAERTHPTSNPRFAVVTVSYGSEDVLVPFLASIPASSSEAVTIAIADNLPGSGGAVERLAAERRANYLPMSSNLGYGSAMNAGVTALPDSVDWILLSNPDVVLSPGTIDALVAVGERDKRIASVGPAILNSDGTLYPSARAVPSVRTGVGHAMFSNLWPGNPWTRRYRNDEEQPSGQRDAGWLSGSCLLVRRSAFDEIGGFDDDYFMYFEDVDLGYRFGKHGLRNVYEPSVKVTHSGAHSTTSDSAKMIAAHHKSARQFLAKKYAGVWLWPMRAFLTVGLSIRSRLIERRITKQETNT